MNYTTPRRVYVVRAWSTSWGMLLLWAFPDRSTAYGERPALVDAPRRTNEGRRLLRASEGWTWAVRPVNGS